MRVLNIAYQQLRRYGKTRVSWAQKLTFGLIKNDHYTQVFSDRDVAAFEAPLGIRDLGVGKANRRLLETVEAFDPDLVIAGHCDMISNDTLKAIKRQQPNCIIAHCNNDPLFVPSNVERIKHRAEVTDAIFVSTGRRELKMFEGIGARVYHMPNPVEPAIENLDNSQRTDLPIDLLFCSNSNNFTKRLQMVKYLKDQLGDELNFKTYGSFGEPPVWGRDYDRALAQTKMGLNFNRQDTHYWYASARMAQLAGNGILQFTSDKLHFDELLPPESVVYFSNEDDLLAKIREFHGDDAKRRAWAARARNFFHTEMNSKLYAQYIVEASTLQPFSHDYVWARDIELDGTLK
ncbi:glycosyltransferase [Microbulbifer thermotolerans]|uniref:glycosyltransferase family protein n=1 Tax=Microbulbifer thermotolerans TaxID=252514 RepID=UPI00224A8500|nr:glycosyltransferase [Microbulbifer thermotolerans]MCX2781086.1 glycosyltransferase [Microbulbifer thermotolerans]MCX2782231.1 glycosyltransferase [Microbulbifer thermotolerans]MCX2804483.1 glycosyltransferase [Microbulbifer thermotolerans]